MSARADRWTHGEGSWGHEVRLASRVWAVPAAAAGAESWLAPGWDDQRADGCGTAMPSTVGVFPRVVRAVSRAVSGLGDALASLAGRAFVSRASVVGVDASGAG